MNDLMQTDAYCKTNIHTYCIDIDKIDYLKDQYQDLEYAIDDAEREIISGGKRETAIDYII